MMVTIADAQELREKLEIDVHALLDKFQRETGVFPKAVYLQTITIQRFGQQTQERVTKVNILCQLP